ncbi:MAG: mannose-1-phosphate guanylyltransferase [Candidatus Moraniibacteriota bacterium]|nr:MAG: mannose-1-phosphate guanylyltransferase [Candidatus Moranbacteria bacterium]
MLNVSLETRPVAVIFAGGQGMRLWPASTRSLPKQVSPIFSKKTLVREAFERALTIFPQDRIVIVTTKDLEEKIKKIIPLPAKNFIVQPKNADTATAMCLTALHLETLFPESIAVLLYSDHKIAKLQDFKEAVKQAIQIADRYNTLVTIGTVPTTASTQFGYIELADPQAERNVYRAGIFKEKPELTLAKRYVTSGRYVWNTGVYIWKTSVLLNMLKEVAPEHYERLVHLRVFIGGENYAQEVSDWFERVEPKPFEKVVSEKISDMLVYVARYSWADVGSWKSVYDLAKKDANGNVLLDAYEHGSVRFSHTSGSMVLSQSKNTVLLGMEDTIVIQTDDNLLICNRKNIDDIKKVITDLT